MDLDGQAAGADAEFDGPLRWAAAPLAAAFLDPNDARNLWVEPADPGHRPGGGINNKKDPVEMKLHTAVCSGKVTLAGAQQTIVIDWCTAPSKLGLS
ncbi:hypothetical protein [Streptomyces sp. NPDC001296]